jgi:HPt (histidine-containing phosphotransfer) domain-containing protein
MVAQVATLTYDEPVRLNRDNLDTLHRQLGASGAENVICRAMEELAVRLSDMAPLYRSERTGDLARLAHSLIGIASQIGLQTLARVAGDVSHCATVNDRIALAATLCRLERIGDRSLTAVWDLQDMTS